MDTIKKVFKSKEMLLKIGFTLLVFFIFKLCTLIPAISYGTQIFSVDESQGFLGILNSFSGDALRNYSIVALGIGPYITASIIIELLQMDIIPVLKEWREEGEVGKRKLGALTRYAGLGIAFVQALAMTFGLSSTLFPAGQTTFISLTAIAITLTAGTALMMWLADQITLRGVGNGSSMLIVAGILISFPDNVETLFTGLSNEWTGYLKAGLTLLMFFVVLIGIVFMEAAVRKIPIQYSNRPGAAKFQGSSESSFPIKLNTASVIPVIFASTIMGIPLTILSFVAKDSSSHSYQWLNQVFNSSNVIGFAIYMILTFVFTIFYTFLQLDPKKTAEDLQKQGAYIPGYRPGLETETYLTKVIFKTTMVGGLYLCLVAALPTIATMLGASSAISIGGTSLLIVVGVAIETVRQIKTDVQDQRYSGFLK